jgi:hypothetical protein
LASPVSSAKKPIARRQQRINQSKPYDASDQLAKATQKVTPKLKRVQR